MLGPTSLFVMVITAIRSFQVFDTVQVLTEGGPNKATEVLLHTMFREGFGFFRTGYASAVTVVFLAFVLGLTLLQARVLERKVHY
jgi:multiple sugar transport system permease protein